ncbi:hypothetical protein EYF80_056679 [Liparis tanakae]|uniref:Uncharacterized protein n=1 Tax=Liparis tanakae TaxID=230148 RepID=A0A4Z2EW79_9TELE|nr:hypothetical protein EYF80_056679 [Liparis tanakae]
MAQFNEAYSLKVLQPSGDIQRQTNPDAPRQEQITVQQLLQTSEKKPEPIFSQKKSSMRARLDTALLRAR